MARRLHQPTLPLLDQAGTHRRECECPRCDAGFRPSESERAAATRRLEEQQARLAAAAALEKKRTRDRIKAMKAELAIEEAERKTAALLEVEAEVRARVKGDPRLEALLATRQAGRPIAEAIAVAERRR